MASGGDFTAQPNTGVAGGSFVPTTGQPGADGLALMMLLNGQIPNVAAPQGGPQAGSSSNAADIAPRQGALGAALGAPSAAAGALGSTSPGAPRGVQGALGAGDGRAQRMAAMDRAATVLQGGQAAAPGPGAIVNGVPFGPAAAQSGASTQSGATLQPGAPGAQGPGRQAIDAPAMVDPALSPIISAASGGPGATNLGLLAAGSAMMAPTHSGQLSEALSNAGRAAVPVIQKQRELAANAALRLQQQEWEQQYRKEMLNLGQQRADTGAGRLAASIPYLQARSAYYQSYAAAKEAGHATSGDIEGNAIHSLMDQVNPQTGQNYTYAEAYSGIRAAARSPRTSVVHYTVQPGTQVGTDGKPVVGVWRIPTTGNGQAEFMPGVQTVRSTQGQESLDLRAKMIQMRTAALANATTTAARRAIATATDQQINEAERVVSNSRDINGKATVTLDAAIGQVTHARASLPAPAAIPTPAAAPAVAAAPTPAPASAPTGAAGTAGNPLGSVSNPYLVMNPAEGAHVPPGAYFRRPDGVIMRRSGG